MSLLSDPIRVCTWVCADSIRNPLSFVVHARKRAWFSDWLLRHRLPQFKRGLRDLGVEEPVDVAHVSELDLVLLGMRPVQVRRFKALALNAPAVPSTTFPPRIVLVQPSSPTNQPAPETMGQNFTAVDRPDPRERPLPAGVSVGTGSATSGERSTRLLPSATLSAPLNGAADQAPTDSGWRVPGTHQVDAILSGEVLSAGPADGKAHSQLVAQSDRPACQLSPLASSQQDSDGNTSSDPDWTCTGSLSSSSDAIGELRNPKRQHPSKQSSARRLERHRGRQAWTNRVASPQYRDSRGAHFAARVAQKAGKGRHESLREDGGHDCQFILVASEPQFAAARRSTLEMRHAGRADSNKGRQSLYNYSHLGTAVLQVLFDGLGNWLVHEMWARIYLGDSHSWMATWHQRAISMAGAPTAVMKKAEIVVYPKSAFLVAHVIRPDTCVVSARRFLMDASAADPITVATVSDNHGLTGSPCNHMKQQERGLFKIWVPDSRSPTGPRAEQHGRMHGAAWYMDAKFVVLQPAGPTDGRGSVSSAFITGIDAAGFPLLHPRVAALWLRLFFGTSSPVAGMRSPSIEHTTLYPQKSDACPSCESLRGDLRHRQQSLKRHLQQRDQYTSLRREAVPVLQKAVVDLEQELAKHTRQAAAAISYYKA